MKTLALVNQKGGCGKTTTAVNLAGALAARGKRVLLVDLDPQAHATLALSVALDPGEASLADVLLRDVRLSAARYEAPGGITLVPATLELGEFEEIARRLVHPEERLREELEELADEHDFALLDCPPRADGVLTANALRAADVALLVIETGAFALQGALAARTLLEELADTMEDPFELRAVATLYDRGVPLSRELLVAIQGRFGTRLFDSAIPFSVRLREAAASGVPVSVLDPECDAAHDFDALAGEVCALAAGLPARAASFPVSAGFSR